MKRIAPSSIKSALGLSASRAFLVVAILAATANAKQPTLIEYPPSYRNFPFVYEKVWNAVVKVLVGDMKFYPQVADPQQGFISTGWKTTKGGVGALDMRVRVHANVKKTEKDTLVTVACELQEFIPVKGTKSGKWSPLPSDHTCEAKILNAIGAKLGT